MQESDLLEHISAEIAGVRTKYKQAQAAFWDVVLAVLDTIETISIAIGMSGDLKKQLALKAIDRYLLGGWLKVPVIHGIALSVIGNAVDWLVKLAHRYGILGFVKK